MPNPPQLKPRRLRTRTGCLTCRQRRKKCDERKPKCVACTRNRVSCTWEFAPEDSNYEQARAVALSRSNALDVPPHAQLRVFLEVSKAARAQPRLRAELELSVHISKCTRHYLSATADTLFALTSPCREGLWTRMVLGEAQAHPFLMDSVDALSSFHCAYLYPEDAPRYVKLARLSNAAGLAKFRSSVIRINKHNATATLTFTFFQILLCLTTPFALGGERPSETIDSLRDLLVALRGYYHLQPASCPYVTDPAVTAWLKDKPDNSSSSSTPAHSHNTDILCRLSHLAAAIDTASFSAEEKRISRAALVQLYSFFASTPLEPNFSILFTWPLILSDRFLDLIMARHPLALIIIAHWSIPVFQDQHWLFDKWADQIFHSVASIVGPKMLYMLQGLRDGTTYRSDDELNSVIMKNWLLEEEPQRIPHRGKNPLVERR
ncbi:hypothetical protein L228DRAFT_246622 [Xylona heveae TC161]|uniref:Zn(2)-C6 fungal-type domain-containing protein n=1 Tax=Xylona heveae (strain CBS 132557 / TC161) TaxID=1328760 RepID=A0A161TD72_XYLHT|nr:hypothetical protein L228DRAFT_246622 [Xylona heveae TC161]KZF23777.1 hypothetical protein L228DRAFT_246622 [Xylona heveae TC161]